MDRHACATQHEEVCAALPLRFVQVKLVLKIALIQSIIYLWECSAGNKFVVSVAREFSNSLFIFLPRV